MLFIKYSFSGKSAEMFIESKQIYNEFDTVDGVVTNECVGIYQRSIKDSIYVILCDV